jgi:hypothetical protein
VKALQSASGKQVIATCLPKADYNAFALHQCWARREQWKTGIWGELSARRIRRGTRAFSWFPFMDGCPSMSKSLKQGVLEEYVQTSGDRQEI